MAGHVLAKLSSHLADQWPSYKMGMIWNERVRDVPVNGLLYNEHSIVGVAKTIPQPATNDGYRTCDLEWYVIKFEFSFVKRG